ncbi:adenosylcobinamide-phosphate synthase CbiB [Thalassobaculum sp. OXR-137]|uniref:adenosylcobinamide-phosphate synthase CbiB n=1 Tax=Thalassobaculum sp. OXR-137 TaxID=3100173 RepID=UPI002AC9A012|nr:adenosylcobinamide-phosphate synthase CbiB [Thalassobaculum sp. OXR-137]WPZ33537.1 adenosylcobinamide-phosphate synthase CbiB [Thalassobaculum sp. OXR-137]
MSALVVAGAMVLDAVTGDPRSLYDRIPHPVTLMARRLTELETWLNRPEDTDRRRRTMGVIALAVYVSAWTLGGLLVTRFLDGQLGTLLTIALASTLLAGRDLFDHVGAVAKALAGTEDTTAAREAVGRIVGRETASLDRPAIARAAIESLAENLSDGFVAPVFWFAVAGFPGLVAYKAINTADSLIGHRSERYRAFGWAAARLDDLANWIPARITAALLCAAALKEGRTGEAWTTARRDAALHLSPNAGWPEAAMAGALGIRLGGPRRYGTEQVDGAWFGTGRAEADAADLSRALQIARRVWIGLILAALAVAFIFD